MGRVLSRRPVIRVDRGTRTERFDTLAGEEPLEIRIDGRALAVTMRTPGADFDLVAGFLLGEGIVGCRADVAGMRYCAGTDENGRNTYNVIDVRLADHTPPPGDEVYRTVSITASCGLCGRTSLDAVRGNARWRLADDDVVVSTGMLVTLADRIRATQRVFAATGGVHAAGLFTAAGELICLREDVGRHNAVDKVVGAQLRAGRVPLTGQVLWVSGRASFELAQKAVLAGVPVLAAVSAPSALAVDLSREAGLTLIGFLRADAMNVYSGEWRIRP